MLSCGRGKVAKFFLGSKTCASMLAAVLSLAAPAKPTHAGANYSLTITGGPSNRVAEMTGAVGHIVGVGARAPPLSWESELSELLASDFAVAHRRAMGEEENLAEKLLAMVLGRRR